MWPREWLPMCMCAWRPAVRKTRVGTLTKDNYVSEKLSPILGIVVFRCERYSGIQFQHRIGAPWYGGASLWRECPISLAMTHVRWLRGRSGLKGTDWGGWPIGTLEGIIPDKISARFGLDVWSVFGSNRMSFETLGFLNCEWLREDHETQSSRDFCWPNRSMKRRISRC